MNNDSVAIFFNAWEVYDQVLDHNYMFHDEAHADLIKLLGDRFNQGSYSVLDLGCGSARHMSQTLAKYPPSRYVGYDLSEVALEEAKSCFSGVESEIVLREGDLLEALKTDQDSYDLIFAGYAQHHLSQEDKAIFFEQAARLLSPTGVLVILDLVRQEGEERSTYLQRYCNWVASEWGKIPQPAIAGIHEHVMSSDYPETRETLTMMATETGLSKTTLFGVYGEHQMLGFEFG